MWMWKRLPTQTHVLAQRTCISPYHGSEEGKGRDLWLPERGLKINKTEIKINMFYFYSQWATWSLSSGFADYVLT